MKHECMQVKHGGTYVTLTSVHRSVFLGQGVLWYAQDTIKKRRCSVRETRPFNADIKRSRIPSTSVSACQCLSTPADAREQSAWKDFKTVWTSEKSSATHLWSVLSKCVNDFLEKCFYCRFISQHYINVDERGDEKPARDPKNIRLYSPGALLQTWASAVLSLLGYLVISWAKRRWRLASVARSRLTTVNTLG